MTTVYRPMTPADIDATTYIRKAALEGLARSQGHEPGPWTPRRYPHFEHLLRTDPDGAWVAESDGTVVGYAMGFTRGPVWFLAQLFVQPEVHAQTAGQELLRRAMDAGRARAARVFAVVSSTSPVAQALYMRSGMFGIAICYRMRGPVTALTALAPARDAVVQATEGWPERLGDLDRHAYGGERTADHQLYLAKAWGEQENLPFGLERGGRLVAYGYAMDDGHIGPFAAYEAADQLALLRVAGDWLASRGVEQANGFIPSCNPTVAGALLAGGWRIESWTFLKASERFGQLDCYLPGGGLLL